MRYALLFLVILALLGNGVLAAEQSAAPIRSEDIDSWATLLKAGELIMVGVHASHTDASPQNRWSLTLRVWYSYNTYYGAESSHSWRMTYLELPPQMTTFDHHGQRVHFTADLSQMEIVPFQCRDFHGSCGVMNLPDLGVFFPEQTIDLTWSLGNPNPDASGTISVTYRNNEHEIAKGSISYDSYYADVSGRVLGHSMQSFYYVSGSTMFKNLSTQRNSPFILTPEITFPPDPRLPEAP